MPSAHLLQPVANPAEPPQHGARQTQTVGEKGMYWSMAKPQVVPLTHSDTASTCPARQGLSVIGSDEFAGAAKEDQRSYESEAEEEIGSHDKRQRTGQADQFAEQRGLLFAKAHSSRKRMRTEPNAITP